VALRLEMSDAQLLTRHRAVRRVHRCSRTAVTIALNEGAAPEGPPADFDYEFEGAALRVFSNGIRFDGVRHQYALDSLLRVLP